MEDRTGAGCEVGFRRALGASRWDGHVVKKYGVMQKHDTPSGSECRPTPCKRPVQSLLVKVIEQLRYDDQIEGALRQLCRKIGLRDTHIAQFGSATPCFLDRRF